MTAGNVSIPGGNPVTADPGLSPRSPPVITVGPVLVTVDPAKISKLAAEFSGHRRLTGTADVVKVHVKLVANPFPKKSWAPVVIVAVYIVFSVRAGRGKGSSQVRHIVGDGSCCVRACERKVLALIVEGSMASLKVAVTSVLGHAPLAGVTESDCRSAYPEQVVRPVVKFHAKLAGEGDFQSIGGTR